MPGESAMPQWLLRTLQVLGVAWALPNTVLGLIAGSVCLARGAHVSVSVRDLALVFCDVPFGPGGALTLGNVILHTGSNLDAPCRTYAHRAGHGEEPRILLADHERAHVYQYMVLGILFLPLYGLCGGVSVRNRFERAADRYAMHGVGWWPWARQVGAPVRPS